jgi:hypothetical protein
MRISAHSLQLKPSRMLASSLHPWPITWTCFDLSSATIETCNLSSPCSKFISKVNYRFQASCSKNDFCNIVLRWLSMLGFTNFWNLRFLAHEIVSWTPKNLTQAIILNYQSGHPKWTNADAEKNSTLLNVSTKYPAIELGPSKSENQVFIILQQKRNWID